MKRALLSLFILIPISFSGYTVLRATQEPATQGTPLPFTQLGPKRSGPHTSFAANSFLWDPLRVVIRDGDTWRDMWKRIHSPAPGRGPYPELPPIPEIDFSREMIVVVAMGRQPNSAFAIIIDGAYERDDRLEIVVRSVSGKGCLAYSIITAPVDIVRLPRTERSVVFRETEVVPDCN
jgi:hypothetical protein